MKLGKAFFSKRYSKWIRPLIYFFVVVFSLFLLIFTMLFVWINYSPQKVPERTLIIVTESNGSLTPEDIDFYNTHKKLSDFIFVNFFGVSRSDLKEKDILEVLNTSIDANLGNTIRRFAKGYGNVIILSNEYASFSNLASVVKNQNDKGKIVDIITFVHGTANGYVYFNSNFVSAAEFDSYFDSANIGYVYQLNCYGNTVSEAWIRSGAKVVNGTVGVNAINLLAPEIFLRHMMWGNSFERSVNAAYKTEIKVLNIAKHFIPGLYWANDEYYKSSKPVFHGDDNLSL